MIESGRLNMKEKFLSRRDTLKLIGAAVLGGAATYLVRNDIAEVVNGIVREVNPENSADVVGGDEVYEWGAIDPGLKQSRLTPDLDTADTDTDEPSPLEIPQAHAIRYNLWETINLASADKKQQFPMTLVVIDNTGRVIIGSNAWPMSYSEAAFERFQNPASYRTLSYIPSARPEYRFNPHTWVHSGAYGKHRFFAGKLEEALRMTPEQRGRTTADTLVASKVNFNGALAYLCQVKYEDAFKLFIDVKPSKIQQVLEDFPGNIVTMTISSMLRVPPDRLGEYAGKTVTRDPIPWETTIAQEVIQPSEDQKDMFDEPPTLGWGWENAISQSRWYMAFCSGSTTEEKKANGNVFHIDEGEWVVGFDIIDRQQNFNPFSL